MNFSFMLVFFGGGVGAMARYGMTTFIGHHMGKAFPWHTLGVNLIGALVIGALTEFLSLRVSGVDHARLLLVTGFLGGFTTFSSFSLESALMWEKGDYMPFAAYVAASVIGTIIAVFCGTAAVRAVL